jgi:TonB family protein
VRRRGAAILARFLDGASWNGATLRRRTGWHAGRNGLLVEESDMKNFALALVLIPAGCAATSATRDGVAVEPKAGTHVDMVAGEATAPSFPARLTEAHTPRAADRLSHRVSVELGGEARADLRLCVGGDGGVTEASVARSSGIAALDNAFVDEARSWRYEPLAAPDATACQNVEISYRVP